MDVYYFVTAGLGMHILFGVQTKVGMLLNWRTKSTINNEKYMWHSMEIAVADSVWLMAVACIIILFRQSTQGDDFCDLSANSPR